MTPILSNMSPDDMRKAIAEVEGWEFTPTPIGGVTTANWQAPSGAYRSECPDYLTSLDAVAPVEARLTDSQREHVIEILMGDAERPLWKQVADAAFATALQRTKAILLATGKATL